MMVQRLKVFFTLYLNTIYERWDSKLSLLQAIIYFQFACSLETSK